jgi:hypothetical protein
MGKILEHKKREPIDGSLVANTIKYTLFPAKSQAFHTPCRAFSKSRFTVGEDQEAVIAPHEVWHKSGESEKPHWKPEANP